VVGATWQKLRVERVQSGYRLNPLPEIRIQENLVSSPSDRPDAFEAQFGGKQKAAVTRKTARSLR
jgi:hypothetical protein